MQVKKIVLVFVGLAVLTLASWGIFLRNSEGEVREPETSVNGVTTLKVVEASGEPQAVIDILQGTQNLQNQKDTQYQTGTPTNQLQPNAGRNAFPFPGTGQ